MMSCWMRHLATLLSVAAFLGGSVPSMTSAAPSNPVIDSNFPDPAVLNDNGVYYAYATNHHGGDHMQVHMSTDLAQWTSLPDALPVLPDWARVGKTWAPDVAMVERGKRYVAFFAADNKR